MQMQVCRAIRSVLTRVTRSDFRKEVKDSLRTQNLESHLRTLQKIDFTHPSVKKLFTVEDCKATAFQFAQTILLMEGIEVYSKGEVAQHFPNLQPFMYR